MGPPSCTNMLKCIFRLWIDCKCKSLLWVGVYISMGTACYLHSHCSSLKFGTYHVCTATVQLFRHISLNNLLFLEWNASCFTAFYHIFISWGSAVVIAHIMFGVTFPVVADTTMKTFNINFNRRYLLGDFHVNLFSNLCIQPFGRDVKVAAPLFFCLE